MLQDNQSSWNDVELLAASDADFFKMASHTFRIATEFFRIFKVVDNHLSLKRRRQRPAFSAPFYLAVFVDRILGVEIFRRF